MKQLFSLVLAGAVLLAGSSVYAGGACCPSKGDRGTEAKAGKAGCGDFLSKLNLTDEQKTKVDALKADCAKNGGCSEENHAKFMKGLKDILTPEQIAQCKASCDKAAKGGCPMSKGDSKI